MQRLRTAQRDDSRVDIVDREQFHTGCRSRLVYGGIAILEPEQTGGGFQSGFGQAGILVGVCGTDPGPDIDGIQIGAGRAQGGRIIGSGEEEAVIEGVDGGSLVDRIGDDGDFIARVVVVDKADDLFGGDRFEIQIEDQAGLTRDRQGVCEGRDGVLDNGAVRIAQCGAGQRVLGETVQGTGSGRGAVQRVIMQQEEHAIGGAAHIDLGIEYAQLGKTVQGGQCVFRIARRRAGAVRGQHGSPGLAETVELDRRRGQGGFWRCRGGRRTGGGQDEEGRDEALQHGCLRKVSRDTIP